MKDLGDMFLDARTNDKEPVFMIRAKDRASIAALEEYLLECIDIGADIGHIADIERIIGDFRNWQTRYPDRMKIPD